MAMTEAMTRTAMDVRIIRIMSVAWLSEGDHLVTLNYPFRQLRHGSLLRSIKIGMVFIDSASGHAGSADLDRDTVCDESFKHCRKVLVVIIRWLADVPCHVHGIIHDEDADILSSLLKFASQPQAVPRNIGVIVRFMSFLFLLQPT